MTSSDYPKRRKYINQDFMWRKMFSCFRYKVNGKGGGPTSSTPLIRFCIVFCSFSALFNEAESFSPLWDSVKTQVFQEYEIISSRGQLSIVRSRLGDVKKHELIVGENVKQNSRLILTCTAWYPSEWVYSGDAEPTYSTNTTIENLGSQGQILPLDDVNGAKRYVATIVIGPRGIKQADTGRYNCMTASPETGMKYKTLSAFYHLFVPGNTLFIRKRGGTILYDLRKSPARIPCGVTNPRVAVSLQKFQHGHLINVDNETMLYHPISGFYPRHDIPGTYVCTAAHNRAFELLHFTLVPKLTDIATLQGIRQSSEEDLEWLFNSFKLGQSNRLHLSTRPPTSFNSGDKRRVKPTPSRPQKGNSDKLSIWKRPTDENKDDSVIVSPPIPSTYRPVYVLFAEDLNRLKAKPPPKKPNGGSGSGSGSASGSASEETEEEEEQEQEGEAEESHSHEADEKETDQPYQFDGQQNNNENSQYLFNQILTTQRPSLRPSLHKEYATTYLPFVNFLNPGAAVIKYKPVVNPAESIITQYSETQRPTTKRPLSGQIVYDVQSNRLVYQEHASQVQSGFTRGTTTRPIKVKSTARPKNKFRIPSLPTQRWPTTKKTKHTTKVTTLSTTPAPPLIPDAVVCVNSPCGKHATCYANTVYYHKQKETRREPACKCLDNYYGNPYLECFPPAQEEADFLSFNTTGLFEKRVGPAELSEELEEGHLKNSEVFPSKDDVIVDLKK